MAKDNITFTLRECIKKWEQQGVVNLEWLQSEDPDTTVEYVLIPDIFALSKKERQDEPSWTFPTSQGKFRFIIKNGYLYPEKVFESCGKVVEHRSRYFDMKRDVETKCNRELTDSSYFSTHFGYGFARVTQSVEHVSAADAMRAWSTYGDNYKKDVQYVINEYKRRKAFGKYSGLAPLMSSKPDCCFLDGFNSELRYMILECEFSERINPIYQEPLSWQAIDAISADDRRDFFLHMWEVPGAQPLLSKLSVIWGVTGWSMLEAFLETDSFPLQAVQEGNATVRGYVNNALGHNLQVLPEVALPSF